MDIRLLCSFCVVSATAKLYSFFQKSTTDCVCLTVGDPATSTTRLPKPELGCSATKIKIITAFCNHVFSEFTYCISTTSFFYLPTENMDSSGYFSGKPPFLSCERVKSVRHDMSCYPVEVGGCFSFSKCRARSSCLGCQT